jgi:hypothetical protein
MKSCKICGETNIKKLCKHKDCKEGVSNICNKCRLVLRKQTSDYNTYRKNMYKYKYKYKDYKRNHDLKTKYNISSEDYDRILKQQDYKCAICGIGNDVYKRRFAVDHNHITGKIRGLLCSNCNTSLGKLKEDKTIITNLLHYLEKAGEI